MTPMGLVVWIFFCGIRAICGGSSFPLVPFGFRRLGQTLGTEGGAEVQLGDFGQFARATVGHK
jgi:hypothetical protein